MSKTKYQEAFDSFAPAGSREQIAKETEQIIEKHFAENNSKEVLKFLYSTIDLTTLTALDTKGSVAQLVEGVNERKKLLGEDFPAVAAICVYPAMISTVKATLKVPEVGIAAVTGGFPASQTLLDVKLVETALTIKEGANEIDIVLNLGAFLENDYATVSQEIEEQKDYAKDATLKVILETGALDEPEAIRQASILSLFSRADFLKTSTGKEYPGATLEAAYVMCRAIKEYADKYGRKVGIKFSGGVRTPEDGIRYYCIVKAILGEEWLKNKLFRIGASSLEAKLREAILA